MTRDSDSGLDDLKVPPRDWPRDSVVIIMASSSFGSQVEPLTRDDAGHPGSNLNPAWRTAGQVWALDYPVDVQVSRPNLNPDATRLVC